MKLLMIVALAALAEMSRADYELSSEECRELGYNKESLKCETCSNFVKFGLEEMVSDCQACCIAEESNTNSHEKYPLAHIEVCECNLARFPQVQAFVKSSMVNQWGSHVKVRHVRGVLPTIVLLRPKLGESKKFNIEKWDTDTITDFLNNCIDY